MLQILTELSRFVSTEEVGTEICGTFASLTYPDQGSFLDNLIEPDSPVQFTGKFDEISLTTATNPQLHSTKFIFTFMLVKTLVHITEFI